MMPQQMFLACRRLLLSLSLLCAALLCWISTAHAHQSSTAYLNLAVQPAPAPLQLEYRLALRDLAFLLPLDQNQDQQITWQELSSEQAALDQLLQNQILLSASGTACDLQPRESLLIEQIAGQTYVVQPLQTDCARPDLLDYRVLKDLDSNHRLLITTQLVATTEVAAAPTQTQLVAATQVELSLEQRSLLKTVGQFLLAGLHHLLIGADHVLFLFCILLPAVYQSRSNRRTAWQPVERPATALRQVIYVATAFTLAHSITLTLATLQIVQLPAKWVESVIAGSIVVAALMNLFGTQQRQVSLAFAFGLVHGFGFANVLSDLPLQPLDRLVALFSFNLGIELGQLLCILIFMPFALALRHSNFYRLGVFTLGSVLSAIIALVWMLQRMFEWG